MTRAIIIHGLRRSGTTILWETLRSDPRLRCYDEPFHPRLAAGATANEKGTWTEFAAHLTALPACPVPIQPEEELDRGLSAAQTAWLAALCDSHDRVVIDIVRGWNRAPDIVAACGDALHVHLVRDPANWAAAHLLPSATRTWKRRLGDVWRRGSFFYRRGGFDGYQYQRIIAAGVAQNHPVFADLPGGAAVLRGTPAYRRLLAFWWGANRRIARDLAATGRPCLTVTLADFTTAPEATVARILTQAGWTDTACDTRPVRVLRPAHGATSPRWPQAARHMGLPEDLFTRHDAAATQALLRTGGRP